MAVGICLGEGVAASVADDIRCGNIPVPSYKTLDRAKKKLDIVSLLFHRKKWRDVKCAAVYHNPDSSPQLGS